MLVRGGGVQTNLRLRVIGAIVRSLLVAVVYFVARLIAMRAIVGSVILLRTI